MPKHSIFQQLQNQVQETGKQSSEELISQIFKWVSSKIKSQNKIKPKRSKRCQKLKNQTHQKLKPHFKQTKKKTIRRRTINKKQLKNIAKQKIKFKVIMDILLRKQKKLHVKMELTKAKGLQCENQIQIIPQQQKKQDFDANIELPPIYQKKILNYSKFSYEIEPIISRTQAQIFQKERKQKIKHGFRRYLMSDQVQEKIDDLNCPICIDILIDPVSTPCGHSFCYKCLDQALLFCSNCPVCRLSIKGLDLIYNSSLNKVIQTKCNEYIPDKQILQNYHSRREIRQNWRLNRVLKTNNIAVGLIIDVRDTQNIWCKGRVDAIYSTNKKITSLLIHYLQWAKLYNQVIQITSSRLAPEDLYSSRTDIPRYNLISEQQNMRGAVISGNNQRQVRLNVEERTSQFNTLSLANIRNLNFSDSFRIFPRLNFLRDFMRNSIENEESSSSSNSNPVQRFDWQQNQEQISQQAQSSQSQQEAQLSIIGERAMDQRRQGSDPNNPISEYSNNSSIWQLFQDAEDIRQESEIPNMIDNEESSPGFIFQFQSHDQQQ